MYGTVALVGLRTAIDHLPTNLAKPTHQTELRFLSNTKSQIPPFSAETHSSHFIPKQYLEFIFVQKL